MRFAMLFAFVSLALPNALAADGELLRLINQYRAGGQNCSGREAAPAKPLRANAKLETAARAAKNGGLLAKYLQRAGYRAESAQWLSVAGATDVRQTMNLLAQRFCGQLMRDSYSEIGIARDGANWSIVLAAPRAVPADGRTAATNILVATNDARASARRCGEQNYAQASQLIWSEPLAAVAAGHSEDMASRNYFSHTAKNGSTPADRVTQSGYRYRVIAENIAAGQANAREVVAGWLDSPTHCANLMNPKVTQMGAGEHADPASKFGIYWTQLLAAPR